MGSEHDRSDELLQTMGFIDGAEAREEEVFIDGWVAAAFGEPSIVESLRLDIAGTDVDLPRAQYRIDSPDVQQAHPSLRGVEACRFAIHVPRAAVPVTAKALIKLTPHGGGRAGRTLFHVLHPELPLPSEENLTAVGGGFNVAYEYLGHLVHWLGLQPDAHVLDIGCGTGRIAYGLAHYLDERGRYEGFDVVEELVSWPRDVITPRHPNFRFQRVDVHNGLYNKAGAVRADEIVFPYEDASFDVVYLTSVFTHMLRSEIERYLAEIARVLRPDGRCLATCFLVDDEAKLHMETERAKLRMAVDARGDYVSDPGLPEVAIGFDASVWAEFVRGAGLRTVAFHPGWWSGRPRYLTYQDTLILARA